MYTMLFIFFFKQKTAYEMRISDWSSDVCSSDLRAERDENLHHPVRAVDRRRRRLGAIAQQRAFVRDDLIEHAVDRIERIARAGLVKARQCLAVLVIKSAERGIGKRGAAFGIGRPQALDPGLLAGIVAGPLAEPIELPSSGARRGGEEWGRT